VIELRLLGIWSENHDDVGPGRCFGWSVDDQAFLFGFGARGTAFVQADTDGDATVTEIEGMSVALRAIADDGDLLRLDEREIC